MKRSMCKSALCWLVAPAAAVALLLPAGHGGRAEEARPALELLADLGVRPNPGPGLQRQLDQYRKAYPQVPHDFWRGLYEVYGDPALLAGALAGIVERELSPEEIQNAVDFYRTPLGQRLLAVRETLAEESQQVSRTLGQTFQEDVRAQLKQGGYLE